MERLQNLIKPAGLFKFITDRAVIAGGSVVYALLSDVPLDTVGDIDIFINSEQTFNEILTELEERNIGRFDSRQGNTYQVFRHEFDHIQNNTPDGDHVQNHTPDEPSDNLGISIVNVTMSPAELSIQLIMSEFQSPMDVINNFDLDYVQCAFYQGQFYQTKYCQEAHQTRQINYFKDSRLKHYRLKKAIAKGFRAPLLLDNLGDDRPKCELVVVADFTFLMETPKLFLDAYFPAINFSDKSICSLKDLKIVNWKPTKKLGQIHLGDFILKSDKIDDLLIQKQYITCEVEIEKYVAFPTIHDEIIGYLELNMPNHPLESVTRIRVMENALKSIPDPSILTGKWMITFKFYLNTIQDDKIKICDINPVDKVSGLKFSDDFRFENSPKFENYSPKFKNYSPKFKNYSPKSHRSVTKLSKIQLIMKTHSQTNENDSEYQKELHRIKHNAYDAFLYYQGQSAESTEIDAIKLAGHQMTIDHNKINKSSDLFCLAFMGIQNNTIDDLIRFIEGFN